MTSPGDLVVCVDVSDWGKGRCDELRRGTIYTIAQINNWPEGIGIELEEVRPTGWADVDFRSERFRPVSRNSSELFHGLLSPIKHEKALTKEITYVR